MKANQDPKQTPTNPDQRLIDALLREHARAGTGHDDAFLARLESAIDADAGPATESGAITRKRPPQHLAWSLGLAATIALAAGLVWKNPFAGDRSPGLASELAGRDGMSLQSALPPELIEGTPKPIKLPGLVPAPSRAPELMVPAGTVLLSRGRPVTSSDDNPIIGGLDLVTDGDKDAGEGYFVELWEGLQWIQIDLEQTATINAIWLWHFHSQRRAYHDVIIQISDDPDFRTGVTTVYNNDYDNSAKMGKGSGNPYVETRFGLLVDGRGSRGRYVRLFSNGNSSNQMNHYIEVEVFGTSG